MMNQSPPNALISTPAAPQAVVPVFAPVQLGLSEENKLAMVEYWRSITKRKWAILGLGVAMAGLAGAIAWSMTPIYRSTATVLVEAARGKAVSIEDLYNSGTQSREHYQTQVEILKSRDVALRTVKALKLWEQPEFDPRKSDDSLGAKLKSFIGVTDVPVAEPDDAALAEGAVKSVMKGISVEPVRLSQLVKVSFESADKDLAAKIANEVSRSYIVADLEGRAKLTQNTNVSLEERAVELKAKLAQSEAVLQKFREDNGLLNIGGSAQALAGKQATDVSAELAAARSRRLQLESAYQTIKGIRGGDYGSVPVVVANASVQAAQTREVEAAAKMAELEQTLGSAHMKVQEARSNWQQAKAFAQSQRQAVVDSLVREYTQALSAEKSFASALQQASTSVQDVNRKEFRLQVLEREVQSNRQLYEMFIGRAKETDASSSVQLAVARVVDTAVASGAPVRPNKSQIVMVAFVLGVFLGAMGSLLLDRLDNTIKGGESAEFKLHQPVLTVLPEIPNLSPTLFSTLFLREPNSHLAEAIRTARTGVQLSDVDEAHRVLLVTSSVPGEGKTSVVTNLSLALSQTKRTLLIDGDMRRPQVGARLGLPDGAKGLSELITGTATLQECVHQIPNTNLMVIPAGTTPPNPTELLLSQRFREVLAHLKPQLDFIMIDSPPVELVSDALAIVPQASSAIYVVRAMKTQLPLARKGLARLQRSGGKIMGVVVNGLDFDKAQRYYGETVHGGYGAYYGNGEEPKSKTSAPVAV